MSGINCRKIFSYIGLFIIISLFIFPETSQAATTTSITQYGITWNFATPVEYGQFVNGDYWVVDTGNGVQVVNITPLSTNIAGRIQHGSMLNPSTISNGYDSTMNNVSYSAVLNVGRPNGNDLSSSNPLIITGGNSLVSTRTNDVANTRPQPVDVSVLTIVTQVPPAGSFRPPYAGTDKTFYWNTSDIRWNLLPGLSKDSITNLPNLSTLENQIKRTWLDQGGGVWNGREFHPSNNMPDYGRDMSIITGNISLALLLDYDQAELNTLMIEFLQLGIDWYGVTENASNIFTTTSQGGLWMGGGGHGIGRKWPMIFAGLMFSDDNILKYADGEAYPIFQEEQQYFYVTQADVDRERYTDDGRPRDPYTAEMIGMPEWGESHWTAPNRDGSNWDAYYRAIVSSSVPGHALSAILMDARNLWNWESFFDYQDRWWAHQEAVNQTGSYSTFVDDMWNTYRDNGAIPIFNGDVDGSGSTNTTDALLTLRNSLGLSMTSTAWQASATTGDVDCNDISNSTDALLILRYSLGLAMDSTAWCED